MYIFIYKYVLYIYTYCFVIPTYFFLLFIPTIYSIMEKYVKLHQTGFLFVHLPVRKLESLTKNYFILQNITFFYLILLYMVLKMHKQCNF